MFVPVFTLNLNHKLLPGRIAIGEFDGEHPCLVAATTGERVLIHTPHQKLTGSYIPKYISPVWKIQIMVRNSCHSNVLRTVKNMLKYIYESQPYNNSLPLMLMDQFQLI